MSKRKTPELTPDDLAPVLEKIAALEAGMVELEGRVSDQSALLHEHEARLDALEPGPPPDPGQGDGV